MFPTFTGSSRKARNVNLSGQKTTNPFTSTSWAPSSASGASKTVASAQAERQQRQQERDRLRAALRIQKSWRGHRVRRNLRTERRELLDQLYGARSTTAPDQRALQAVPLVLAVFQASRPEDHQRLGLVAQDLLQTRFSAFHSGQLHATRLNTLIRAVITALERTATGGTHSQTQVFLETLNEIIKLRPEAVEHVLGQYYRVLGRCCHNMGPDSQLPGLLRTALVAPLVADGVSASFTQSAYRDFAFSFLTQQNLVVFERNVGAFAADVDTDRLSETLLAAAPGEPKTADSLNALLWLLAHFIALQRARQRQTLHLHYLRALHLLLSALTNQLRVHFSVSGDVRDAEEEALEAVPPYVAEQAVSLIDKEGITELLEKITSNQGASSISDQEDASFLAGYFLTLISCFPKFADDIRMRFYLADIPTQQGKLPAVRFFWNAVRKTSLFSVVVSSQDAALDVLRQELSVATFATASGQSHSKREWQTVLLFLELYVFVLRLTDDDDFFSELNPTASYEVPAPVPRLRASSLPLAELKRLTLFLKHLGFTLYYNAAELLDRATGVTKSMSSIQDFLASPARPRTPEDSSQNSKKPSTNVTLIAGIDFGAFRGLVTTAVRMLYERDSRRPFLPKGHWLMTSKFDMEGFLSAVVLEEQRQHELRESGGDEADSSDDDDFSSRNLVHAGPRHSLRHAQLEKLRGQQKRAARDRLRATIGPKMEILRNMPFVIPFETRVQIFRQFVYLDKERRRKGYIDADQWRMSVLNEFGGMFDRGGNGRDILSQHHAEIRRGHVFSDAMKDFWGLGEGLKEPIQISFVDEFGIQEAGVDGGGVTKEFLTSVTKEAFTQESFFVTNKNNAYYPNPCIIDAQRQTLREARLTPESEDYQHLMAETFRQFEFLGRIIGKCMYEGILIDIVFAGFFLLQWTSTESDSNYRANINDLRELDEELYQGMLSLKNYPGDVGDFGLDFTITDQASLPGQPTRTITRNLIPNGDKIAVTNENRPLYISYVARHRLAAQSYVQTRAFLRGLRMIISPSWLNMFNQTELQRLVGGDNSEIDVEDLRRHAMYSGVYQIGDDGQEHPTVKLFWEVMRGLADHERRDVLKYVTSTPRAPLLGFSQLSPPFTIRDGGQDQERLPSASTCVNLLKLPQYKSAAVLKSKLLYAVQSGAGFDLS
ncbi:hypothetical protein QBC46DRAFT_302822 [Diplogelasinospora grovesii]|uniref:HECT-type E3 ubiquitin transferase n=1 Tax=Diplogelasinospora grovesii TaxID=303347 RepID=A0AAN6S9P5_9PEZI|nr:hypothetical protein QBC46DRAFT_302822 [Diplogelasinospora grovesii]